MCISRYFIAINKAFTYLAKSMREWQGVQNTMDCVWVCEKGPSQIVQMRETGRHFHRQMHQWYF